MNSLRFRKLILPGIVFAALWLLGVSVGLEVAAREWHQWESASGKAA